MKMKVNMAKETLGLENGQGKGIIADAIYLRFLIFYKSRIERFGSQIPKAFPF